MTFYDGNALDQYEAHGGFEGAKVDKWYGRRIVLRFDHAVDADVFWQNIHGNEMENVKIIEEDHETFAGQWKQDVLGSQEESVLQDSTDKSLVSSQQNEPYSMSAWMSPYQKPWAAGVRIAALDSGISGSSLLSSILTEGYDFVSDPGTSMDGDGRDADWTDPGDSVPGRCEGSSWHGTMTGTLLASPLYNISINNTFEGIVPSATLIPVRVLGACKTGYASDVADAIVWASGGAIRGMPLLDRSAQVVLMPFSGRVRTGCPSYLQSAVDLAISRNVTLVASAGNNYNQSVQDYIPANCKGVYSVGALDSKGLYTDYTNTGASFYFPGGDNEGPLACMSDGNQLVSCMGTSFAAVLAAGWVGTVVRDLGGGGDSGGFEVPQQRIQSYYKWNQISNGTEVMVSGDGLCAGFSTSFCLKYSGGSCTSKTCGWGLGNACVWGKRYAAGWPQVWTDLVNANSAGLDEFCICDAGYYAFQPVFFRSSACGYGNGDARPSGYCRDAPAAYDSMNCEKCPAGSYCPGGGYYQDKCGSCASTNCGGCGCPDCYYIKHQEAIPCIDCVPGKYWTKRESDCGVYPSGASTPRDCLNCAPGKYSTGTNDDYCFQWTVCGPGSYVTNTPSERLDRTCSSCDPGKYSEVVNAGGCTLCGAGKYYEYGYAYSETLCSSCIAGTASEPGSWTCTECPAGTYASSVGQTWPCPSCPTGKVSYDIAYTQCQVCAAGKYASPGASTCTVCPVGTFWDSIATGTTVCTTCASGFVASSTGATSCSTCSSGNYASSTSSCTACPAGKFWNSPSTGNTDCTPCASGKYAATVGKTVCSTCNAGYYASTASTCTACAVGKFWGSSTVGTTVCSSCTTGKYASGTQFTACLDCSTGKYAASSSQSTCNQCPSGKYGATIALSVCTDCLAGKYSSTVGANSSTACKLCVGAGYTYASGASVCFNCTADKPVSVDHQSCGIACVAGSVPKWTVAANNNGTDDAGCVKCSEISPLETMFENITGYCAACTVCKPGEKYQTGNCSSTINTLCTPCPICSPLSKNNFYMKNCTVYTGSECKTCSAPCDTQTYEAQPCTLYADRDCRVCSTACKNAGYYINATCTPKSDIDCQPCVNCTAGSYASRPCLNNQFGERGECAVCPRGKFSSAPNLLPSCTDCPAGQYASSNTSTLCLYCPAGKFANISGASLCTSCSEGKFSIVAGGTRCNVCEAGTFLSNATTGSCTPCLAGSYAPSSGLTTCIQCPAGSFAASLNASSCQMCAVGSFSAGMGASACTLCPAGTRSNKTSGSTQCHECLEGTYANATGSSSCTACASKCVLSSTYTAVECSPVTNRVCSSCTKQVCPPNQTSNVSWCPPSGTFSCMPCPSYGNDAVHLVPDFSCETCPQRNCGLTPGTYISRKCESRLVPPYGINDTYVCGRCRGCSYRQCVISWGFCSGVGEAEVSLNTELESNCKYCNTSCSPGHYITNLCNGRTVKNTETCAQCTGCAYGSYHAKPIQGLLNPEFDGGLWTSFSEENPCNGKGILNSDGFSDCARCDTCPLGKYASDVKRCTGNGIWKDNFTCTDCKPCASGYEHTVPCNGLSFNDSCKVCVHMRALCCQTFDQLFTDLPLTGRQMCPPCEAGYHPNSTWNSTSKRMVCGCNQCLDAPTDVCPMHFFKTNRTCSGQKPYDEACEQCSLCNGGEYVAGGAFCTGATYEDMSAGKCRFVMRMHGR